MISCKQQAASSKLVEGGQNVGAPCIPSFVAFGRFGRERVRRGEVAPQMTPLLWKLAGHASIRGVRNKGGTDDA